MLENGLRYAIKRQPHPVGSVSLRMVVLAGSMHETSEESGIAHFTEHMAFNGTNKFRKETLGSKLAESGIRFGADLTAFTAPSYTVYHLDLPAADKIHLGITVLREWASEIRFDRRQVSREKGVIRSEHRSRGENAANYYIRRQKILYPDTPLSQSPLGAGLAQVDKVTSARLKAFYNKWYRPDNTIIVATGDIEPSQIEGLLREKFDAWENPISLLEPVKIGRLEEKDSPTPRTSLLTNDSAQAFSAELVRVKLREQPESLDTRRRSLELSLGLSAFSKRLRTIQQDHPEKFGSIKVRLASPTPFSQELIITAQTRLGDWDSAVTVLIEEYRRLIQHGLEPNEIDTSRKNRVASSNFSISAVQTEKAKGLANRLVKSIVREETALAFEFSNDFEQEFLPQITPEDCMAAMREFFGDRFPDILLTSSHVETLKAEEVAAVIDHAMEADVLPPEIITNVAFPYDDFGPSGAVVNRSHHVSLDVHMLEFENGLKLNLKSTNFDKGSVFITVRIDNGGRLRGKPAISSVAEGALISGGLDKIQGQKMDSALAGKSVRLRFSISENAFKFNGLTRSHDLVRLLQVLTAFILEPAVEADAVRQSRERIKIRYVDANNDVSKAVSIFGQAVFYNNDTRLTPPKWKDLESITPDQVRNWLKSSLAVGSIEVGIVGDIDVETAIEAAASTLGTLPTRLDSGPIEEPELLRSAHRVGFPVQSTDNKSSIMISWPTDGFEKGQSRRTIELLSQILLTRLKEDVREKRGIVYTPTTNSWSSPSFPDQGYLQTKLIVEPNDLKKVHKAVTKITNALARGRISQAELNRAREPLLQGIEAQLSSNRFWVEYVVSRAQTNSEALKPTNTRRIDLEGISMDEIEAVAAAIFKKDNEIVIFARPNP